MRRLIIACLLCLVVTPITAQAQDECLDDLPCGALLWPLPEFPALQSPTPIPTSEFNGGNPAPPQTATPTPTLTPTPTPTGFIDTGEIENFIGTAQAIANGTPVAIVDFLGTPVNAGDELTGIAGDAGVFFGYARAVMDGNMFGHFTPLIVFLALSFTVVLAISLTGMAIPIVGAMFGFLRKVVTLILDFLPF